MATTMKVRDVDYEVYVKGQSFAVDALDTTYTGYSWDELYKKLMTATAKAKVSVSVPFTTLYADQKFVRGVARGIHSGTGKILVTIKGENSQYDGYSNFYRVMDAAEMEQGEELLVAARAASAALEEWLKERKIALKHQVEKAIEAAMGAQ